MDKSQSPAEGKNNAPRSCAKAGEGGIPASSISGSGLRMQGVARGACIRFIFNGAEINAFEGESVAAALHAAGIDGLRQSPRGGASRGPFCWMGTCQECVVVVDGVRRPACRTAVVAGMIVSSGVTA